MLLSPGQRFLPYSSDFLTESLDIDVDGSEEQEVPEVEEPPKPSDEHPFYAYPVVDREIYVVGLELGSRCYLMGFGSIQSLTDNIVADGFKFSCGDVAPFHRPVWSSAFQLGVSGSTTDKRVVLPEVQTLKKKTRAAVKHLQDAHGDVIVGFVLLRKHIDLLQLMVHLEDHTSFRHTRPATHKVDRFHCLSVDTALIAHRAHFLHHRLSVLHYPDEWSQCMQEQRMLQVNQRVMVTGPKGVGKSQTLRYLIHRALAYTPRVWVLDLDLGQPEFTPPGYVSLVEVCGPLLTVGLSLHTQIPHGANTEPETPQTANDPQSPRWKATLRDWLCVGDVSATRDPDAYLRAVSGLHDRFMSVFHPSHKGSRPLLLVNGDGFLRHLGGDLLQRVLQLLRPQHLLWIDSADPDQRRFSAPLRESLSAQRSPRLTLLPSAVHRRSALQPPALRHLRSLAHFLGDVPRFWDEYPESGRPRVRSAAVHDPCSLLALLSLQSLPRCRVSLRRCLFLPPPGSGSSGLSGDSSLVSGILGSLAGRLLSLSCLSAQETRRLLPNTQTYRLRHRHAQIQGEEAEEVAVQVVHGECAVPLQTVMHCAALCLSLELSTQTLTLLVPHLLVAPLRAALAHPDSQTVALHLYSPTLGAPGSLGGAGVMTVARPFAAAALAAPQGLGHKEVRGRVLKRPAADSRRPAKHPRHTDA